MAQAEALGLCEGRQQRRLDLHPGAPIPIPTASLQLCGLRQAGIPVIHMSHGLCAKAVNLDKWPCPPLKAAALLTLPPTCVCAAPTRPTWEVGETPANQGGVPSPSPFSHLPPHPPAPCHLKTFPAGPSRPVSFFSPETKGPEIKGCKEVAEAWGFLLVQKMLYTDPSMPSTVMQAPNNVQNKTQTLLYLQAEVF